MKDPFPRVALKRVAKLGTGHTPSRSHPEYWLDRTIPWLTLADVGPLRAGTLSIVTETKEKISELGVANSSAVVHSAGTVVMSRTASVGFSAILGRDMATSQDYVTWTCGPDAEPRFVLHALRGLRDEILSNRMGSTHQTIYMPDVERIRIPLPSPDQQRRIADFLDVETARIDALIAAKRQMLDVLDRAAQSMLDEVLSGVARECAPLRRFVSSLTQGTSGVAGSRPAEGSEWGLLKLSAVRSGVFRSVENKVVDDDFPIDPSLKPAVGDLLVTRSNTPTYVGDACAVRVDAGQVLLPDLIYRLRLDGRLDPQFASMALRSSEARHALSSAARGTSQSMVKLRGEDILNVIVPVPPLSDQRAVVALHDRRLVRIEAITNTLTTQVGLLRERRQALITAAVTGEIEV